jgi:hypothetical protein
MATKLDKVIARKKLDEKVRKEIKRRQKISKKSKGKKRTRKPKSKYKKRRKKKITTTQVAQPPIRLSNKAGDKLEVNITAKERRKKRKKPKSFAEKRAEEIAGTGVADASVLRHGQKVASEVLGYSTQARDPLKLRGGASRYNVAGGVAGFHDVSARYDTREPQKGIRTPQTTIEQRIEQLEEKVDQNATDKRSSRRANMKGRRKKKPDDDDDDDDFQDPQGKPQTRQAPKKKTIYPQYDYSGFRPISELEPPEDIFYEPAYVPYRPLTAETRAPPVPPAGIKRTKKLKDPPALPKLETSTDESDFEDDEPPTQPKPIFIGGGPPKQKFKKASRVPIPPPSANFGVEPEPEPTSFAGRKKPQPQPEPEPAPAPAPRPESPIEDFEFVDAQTEEPPEPVAVQPPQQEQILPEREEEEDKPPIQAVRRGRPAGAKAKPQSEETKELKKDGKRLLSILKNVLGKGNFKAKDLDDISTDADFDAVDFEAIYGDIDPETASNLRLYWMVRQALGLTPPP